MMKSMIRKIGNVVLMAVLMLTSCNQEEMPVNTDMQFSVSGFPVFEDTDSRAVGTLDAGKTNWQSGDQILLSVTSRKYGKNTAVLVYDGTKWTTNVSLPYLEGESPEIKAVYAPAYQWTGGNLTLKENMMAGMEEYIDARCTIIGNNTISLSFSGTGRNYSRLRIATTPNMEFSFSADGLIPSGQSDKVSATYNLRSDAKGNAFLYGTFKKGASVEFVTNYEMIWKQYSFITPTSAGKSYVLDVTDNPKKYPYRRGDIVTLVKKTDGNCSGCGKPSDVTPTGTVENVEKMENGTIIYSVKLDHCGNTVRLIDTAISGKKHRYSIGDVVNCEKTRIEYCPKCGKLLRNYQATIIGLRGTLDGNDVYWIYRHCCSSRNIAIETEITGLADKQ